MSLKKDLQKYKPRKEQNEALSFIDSEYQKNKLNKFFLLNLPVLFLPAVLVFYFL